MPRILDRIDSPDNVKQLSLAELEQLAAEIREELITVLSSNGGHLGPNLGVVELSSRCTTSSTRRRTASCST